MVVERYDAAPGGGQEGSCPAPRRSQVHALLFYLSYYVSIYLCIYTYISTNLFIYLSINLTTYLSVHADDRYSGTLTWPSYIVVHDDSVDADLTDQVHKALARSLIL